MMDDMLKGAPLDEEGFTLTDRWFCEETCTDYPVGTTVREIEMDAKAAEAKEIYENKTYTITFTSNDIRGVYPDATLTEEEVDQIAFDLEAMFDGYFFDWVRA